MKNSLLSRIFTPIALVTFFSAVAAGGPVILTLGAWQTEPFTLMNPGDFFPTAYQAPAGELIDITGYYVTGDYYSVYINGVLSFTTKQVSPIGIDYGDQTPPLYADPASAFASGLFSTAQFRVNAGDLITIADLYPPDGIGELGIQAVPEPAAFALLALGFLTLAAIHHRRAMRA